MNDLSQILNIGGMGGTTHVPQTQPPQQQFQPQQPPQFQPQQGSIQVPPQQQFQPQQPQQPPPQQQFQPQQPPQQQQFQPQQPPPQQQFQPQQGSIQVPPQVKYAEGTGQFQPPAGPIEPPKPPAEDTKPKAKTKSKSSTPSTAKLAAMSTVIAAAIAKGLDPNSTSLFLALLDGED